MRLDPLHTDYLIGIDDTDNATSRGTGFHARVLAHELEAGGMVSVNGITRHQLFVDPAIRYTSRNSAACIHIMTDQIESIQYQCAEFLLASSAPGSDAGLCIAAYPDIPAAVVDWGRRAKTEVLGMGEATTLAKENNIYLEGFTGTHEGIIGALAAAGLYANGNDGRYIWRRGIRELREAESGIYSISALVRMLSLDGIITAEGMKPGAADRIFIDEWVRPVRKNNQAILLTEKNQEDNGYEWKLTSKAIIQSIY